MIGASWRGQAVLRDWARLVLVHGWLVALLLIFRSRFDWDRELIDIPSLGLAAGMVAAGLAFLATPYLVHRSQRLEAAEQRTALTLVIGAGLALRVLLLWSTPALEDDFHRYLWDGAITAHGLNPYRIVPAAATVDGTPQLVKDLATSAGYIFERINHAELRTIYPPVAQALFALAYLAEPWSLLAWRLVCLVAEGASLVLLLLLLKQLGRSPMWVALYWLNPLVMKELVNSAHMEAIMVPFVLAALLLAMRRRPLVASIMIVLAAGTKLWPLLLAPLILRPLLGDARRLAVATAILGAGCLALAAPIVIAGLDPDAGVVAYATRWQRNGALVPGLSWLFGALGVGDGAAGSVARGLVVVVAGVTAVALAWRPIDGDAELVRRATVLATAVLLLSPAQYPWYLVWVMPLMALHPIGGMLLATALMPIYYVSFHFRAIGIESVFNTYVVWLIWVPIWSVLWYEWQRGRPLIWPASENPRRTAARGS